MLSNEERIGIRNLGQTTVHSEFVTGAIPQFRDKKTHFKLNQIEVVAWDFKSATQEVF